MEGCVAAAIAAEDRAADGIADAVASADGIAGRADNLYGSAWPCPTLRINLWRRAMPCEMRLF
jgi:hypothetical protein